MIKVASIAIARIAAIASVTAGNSTMADGAKGAATIGIGVAVVSIPARAAIADRQGPGNRIRIGQINGAKRERVGAVDTQHLADG